MSTYPTLSELQAARARAATLRGQADARSVLARLREAGLVVKLVGSAARGRMREGSDIDVLVLDRGGLTETEALALAEAASNGRPVDLVFAEGLRATTRRLFDAEAVDEPGAAAR